MSPRTPLPRPAECPDYIDWHQLPVTAQHGLMARLEQLGRIDITEDDARFNARLIAGARRTA